MTAVPPAVVAVPTGPTSRWTDPMDVQELARHIAACKDTAANSTDKGHRLEQLLCWLLTHINGVEVVLANQYSADGSQEIDLTVWNSRIEPVMQSFETNFVAECKNWARRVDSSDVAWFDWKMRLGNAHDGVLLAANGVTTEPQRRTDAAAIIDHANADGRRIYVITLDEVAALSSTADLLEMLKLKRSRLMARAGL